MLNLLKTVTEFGQSKCSLWHGLGLEIQDVCPLKVAKKDTNALTSVLTWKQSFKIHAYGMKPELLHLL